MKIKGIVYVLIIGLFASCAPSRNAQDMTDPAELSTTYQELADYLRRVPGVLVTGSSGNYSVLIRGISSISGSNEPLYVIDRMQVGSYEQATAMVDPNDIAYVEVLKDVASTTAYGMRGSNGVIIIHTKK